MNPNSYETILDHYYTGPRVQSVEERPVGIEGVRSDTLEQFIDNLSATEKREIHPRDAIDAKIEAVTAAVLSKAMEANQTPSELDVKREYDRLNPLLSNHVSDSAQSTVATEGDDAAEPHVQMASNEVIQNNVLNLNGANMSKYFSKVQLAIYRLHQQSGGRVAPPTLSPAVPAPVHSAMLLFPMTPRKKTILKPTTSVSAGESSTTSNISPIKNPKSSSSRSSDVASHTIAEPQSLCVKRLDPLHLCRRPPGVEKSPKALMSLYEMSFYMTRDLALSNRQYYSTGSFSVSGARIPSVTHCVIAIDKPKHLLRRHFTSTTKEDEGSKMFNIISVLGGDHSSTTANESDRVLENEASHCDKVCHGQLSDLESPSISVGGNILTFMKDVPHVDKRNMYILVDPDLPVNPFFDIDCSKWSFHCHRGQSEGPQPNVSSLEKLQRAVNTSLIFPLLQTETTPVSAQECTELLSWLILESLSASLEAYFTTPLLPEDDSKASQVICNVSRVTVLTSSVVIGDNDVKLSLHAHFTLLSKHGSSDGFLRPTFFKNITEHKLFASEFLALGPAAKKILEFDASKASVVGIKDIRILGVLRRVALNVIELQISAMRGNETTIDTTEVVRILYNEARASTVNFISPMCNGEQEIFELALDECKQHLTVLYTRILHELLCNVVDCSVYTKWRPFRLPYNTKMVDFWRCIDEAEEKEEHNNTSESDSIQILDGNNNMINNNNDNNNNVLVNQNAPSGATSRCSVSKRNSIGALIVLEEQFDEEVRMYHKKCSTVTTQQNNFIVFANSIIESAILCESNALVDENDEGDLSSNSKDKDAKRSVVARYLLPLSPDFSFDTPRPVSNPLCSFLLKYGNDSKQIALSRGKVDQQYFHQTVIEDSLIHPYRYPILIQRLMQGAAFGNKVQISDSQHSSYSAFHHYTRARLYSNIIRPLRDRYRRLIHEVKSVIAADNRDESAIKEIRQNMMSLSRECETVLNEVEPSLRKQDEEVVNGINDSLCGTDKIGSKRPIREENTEDVSSDDSPHQKLCKSLMDKERNAREENKNKVPMLNSILNFDFSGNADSSEKITDTIIPERRKNVCPFGVAPIVSMVVLKECLTEELDQNGSCIDVEQQTSCWQEFSKRVQEVFFGSDQMAPMPPCPFPRTPFGCGRRVVINDRDIREVLAEVFRCLDPQFDCIKSTALTECMYEDNGTSRMYYVRQKTNKFCLKLHRPHKSTFGQLYLTYNSIKYRCYSNDCHHQCLSIDWCDNNELEDERGDSHSYPGHRKLLSLRNLLFPDLFPEQQKDISLAHDNEGRDVSSP